MIKVESIYPSARQSYYQRKQKPSQKKKSNFQNFQEVLDKELVKKEKKAQD